MTVDVVTFGCRLNAYESEVMKARALESGLTDAVLVNTCAVTAEAERQARQTIRRLRRERPGARIIVSGCGAQVHPDMYSAMPEVDGVLGNHEKMQKYPYDMFHVKHAEAQVLVNDIMSVKETAGHLIDGLEGKARAFVQVQNGCNHRCTFCIIPYGRGNSRSVAVGEVVSQIRALVERGYKEVVLTGVDISSYGEDLPGNPTLGQLCRRILQLVPELPRLRLSSIDAVEVDDDLYRLIAEEPRLMPHLHISLQAGDDLILKRMKRRHLRADALAFCDKVRALRPDMVFGADIIAGFPTETEEHFENTLRLVDEAGLTYLHVFPYSARTGTPAARMPQVKKDIRKERAARLREAGSRRERIYYESLVGSAQNVLVESEGYGHSEGFAKLRVPAHLPAGSLHQLKVTDMKGGFPVAKAA